MAGPRVRDQNLTYLDGRNRAIAIAESLARVIAAIRIASVRWRSDLPPKHRNYRQIFYHTYTTRIPMEFEYA